MTTVHNVAALLSPDIDSDTLEISVIDNGSIEARINSETKFVEIEAHRVSHKHETVLTIKIKDKPSETLAGRQVISAETAAARILTLMGVE